MIDEKIGNILKKVPVDYYDNANFIQNLWHIRKINSFKQIVGESSYNKILDIGCASGTLTKKISEICNGQITAIDAYNKAIVHGRKKYPQINFLVADAHKLPFKSDYFDLIVSYETIEHLVDPLKALKEIHRVLKKDGKTIIAMDSGSLLFRIVWLFWENTKGKIWQGAHLHPFHHTELEKVIKKAGFKILNKKFTHLGMEVTFILKK